MPCRSAARTHVGAVRRRNEDAVLERAEIGLWAVADGAGGHERGDYASSRIIAALRQMNPALTGFSLVEEVETRFMRTLLTYRVQGKRNAARLSRQRP